MDPGNQGSARCVLLTHPGGPGGQAGAAGPTSRVGGSSDDGRAGGRRDDAEGAAAERARAQACPASAFASFVLPSYPTSFLASPHSSSSLLSPSAAAAAFTSVAGMQFPSYFGIYFGPLPRGPIFRSLAPSLPTSFFAPSDRESSGLPVRLRAGARQWQRYHVTSTPPSPHLKKANCIERHRCHRRPPFPHRPFVPSKLLSVRLFQPRHFG